MPKLTSQALTVLALVLRALAAHAADVAVLPVQLDADAKKWVPAIIDEYVLTAVEQEGHVSVIGQNDVNAMLSFERQKDLLGCDDSTCIAEIVGALGVDRLVVVTIAKLGSLWVMSAKLVNVHTPTVDARASLTIYGGAVGLIKSVPELMRELFAGGQAQGGASAALGPNRSSAGAALAQIDQLAAAMWPAGPYTAHTELRQALEPVARGRIATLDRLDFAWATDNCNAGVAEVCLDAGAMALLGFGTERSLEHAIHAYSRACVARDPTGCILQRAVAIEMLATRQSVEDAYRAVGVACAQGDEAACLFLSRRLVNRPSDAAAALSYACRDLKHDASCGILVEQGREGAVVSNALVTWKWITFSLGTFLGAMGVATSLGASTEAEHESAVLGLSMGAGGLAMAGLLYLGQRNQEAEVRRRAQDLPRRAAAGADGLTLAAGWEF